MSAAARPTQGPSMSSTSTVAAQQAPTNCRRPCRRTQEATGASKVEVVADRGYYSGPEARTCEQDRWTARAGTQVIQTANLDLFDHAVTMGFDRPFGPAQLARDLLVHLAPAPCVQTLALPVGALFVFSSCRRRYGRHTISDLHLPQRCNPPGPGNPLTRRRFDGHQLEKFG